MTETMVHLTSRVPRDLLDKLEALAVERRKQTGRNVSRADLVREALEALADGGSAADMGQPLTHSEEARWETFGAIVLDALADLEEQADFCGVIDAQDMAMTLAVAAEQDPRTPALRKFVSKLHGALNSG